MAIALAPLSSVFAQDEPVPEEEADEDEDELGVVAEVSPPIARTGGDDPTAAATEIDARERPHALETLADGLLEAPGARPLRTGALGSPTTLSLRGSEADQVEVLFGDVPLTTADGTPFDLSTIPLWALERVEVYRGGAPTWLGVGGIGGVLRLIPRQESRGRTALEAAGGVGSYGLGHARVGGSGSLDAVDFVVAAGLSTSQGDFPYVSDVTLLDGSDDAREVRRQNAWVTQGSGLGSVRVRIGDGRLSAFFFGRGREGGVPGRAVSPALDAYRREADLLGGVAWEATEGGRAPEQAGWRYSISASAGYRNRIFRDLGQEIADVPIDANDEAFRATVRAAGSGRALPWLELTAVGLFTHEELRPEDAEAPIPDVDSARDLGTLGAEARLFGETDGVRYELRPSARIALIDSRLHDLRFEHLGEETSSLMAAPTFRLGGAIEPMRGLTISVSGASATRAPNLVELFGDRGFLKGDSTLRPERAETFDVGVALRGRVDDLQGRAELRAFLTLASDLIRYARLPSWHAIPQNVDSATIAGGELGFRGSLTRHFALTGAWTLLGTWTEHGGRQRRLPLRPWMTGYVRPELRTFDLGPLDRLAAWADLTYVSETFWDPANTSALASRVRLGLGVSVEVWESRLRMDVGVRDALDARGTDLLGFPLPGRSFFASLAVRAE